MTVLPTAEQASPTQPRVSRPVGHLGYQPALDGIRALAVGLVLAYHGGLGWARGGYLGVDVFFVLSGFLITYLLIVERDHNGRISIAEFYARRARRLLPAMTVVLVAVAAWGWTFAPNDSVRELRGDVVATATYATNWRLVLADRGYFEDFAAPSPLQHTWSLAVEEQWYLAWPLVLGLLLAWRARQRRSGPSVDGVLIGVTVVAAAASGVWAAHLATPGSDPSRVYYGTDTRAYLLLAGSILAMALARHGRVEVPARWRGLTQLAGLAGLVIVMRMALTVDQATSWLYEGGSVGLALAVVAVILAVLQPRSRLGATLSVAPLRRVGELSYGLYLWHLPVYVALTAARTDVSGNALFALRIAVTAGLAVVSDLLIERPIRLAKWPLGRVLAISVTTAVAVVAVLSAAVAVREPDPATRKLEMGSVAAPAGPLTYDPAANPPPPVVAGDTAPRVLVTGDSVALTTSLGYEQKSGTAPLVLWDKSMLGCPLFTSERTAPGLRTDGGPQCEPWRADRTNWPSRFEPDVVAILSGVWEVYDRVVEGRDLAFGSPEFDRWFSAHLDELIDQLAGTTTPVALITAPCNRRTEYIGADPPENDDGRIDHLNDLYRAAERRRPAQVHLIDLHEFTCPDGEFRASVDGVRLRDDDGVHFDLETGSELVRAWMYPRLVELAQR